MVLSDVSQLFSYYDQAEAKRKPVILSKGQSDILQTIITRTPGRVQILCPTQYGKLIADDTPVLTTNGWKTHGDLVVGDYVFNNEGKPVIVEGVGEKFYADREVVFSNGEKIRCHHLHEWMVKNRSRWQNFKAVETRNLYPIKHGNHNVWYVPNIAPIEFPEANLPLDPYTLGVWLGDGTTKKPTITGDKKDSVIIDALAYKPTHIYIHKTTGVYSYDFWKTDFWPKLKEIGVVGNKHIPEIYKRASVEQRLALLAGMIDTDGYVYKDGGNGRFDNRVYITSCSKTLIDDFCELIRSLGMRPSVVTVKPTSSSSGVQGRQLTYVIGFTPALEIPTVLPRKRVYPKKLRQLSVTAISEIEPVGGNCIQVAGGIYLVGKTLVPTHNSFTVSMGLLLRASTFPEKWAVVAPNEAKAKIIMRYVIDHIFNNQIFVDQLDVNDPLERLRKEQSKTRITFKRGGELFILSADSKNKAAAGEALMGFGAPNVIIDESSLIDDDIYSKIKRMVGGSQDNFILEIGNPFKRNHFLRTFRDSSYKKIKIDWKQAVQEKRLMPAFIEEMRKEAFFDVLYECEFPREEDVDMDGWSRLLSDNDIENSFRDEDPNVYGTKKLGIDVARGGGNFNVWVLRVGNYAKVVAKTSQDNLMEVIGTSKAIAEEHGVDESHIYLDATGLGSGVYDRFRETGWDIRGINLSSQADDTDKYANKRAEMYFRLRQWIKNGGMLEHHQNWYELADIKYKLRSSGKLKIIDKDALRRVGIPSPDVADALALTFADEDETNAFKLKQHVFETRQKQKVKNVYV